MVNDETCLVKQFTKRCEAAEFELRELNNKLKALQSGNVDEIAAAAEDEELRSLITRNKKLKYRINIMKRSNEEPSTKDTLPNKALKLLELPKLDGNHMVNILGYLEVLFSRSILEAFPGTPNPPNVQMQISKVADYQCNAALALAKALKKNPKDVGQSILDKVGSSPLISKIELSGPGFINIYLSNDFVEKQISRLLEAGVTPPTIEPKRVVVDFSSPNIAKEMHVGHLRSTIIGESICRLLEFLGHNVLRLNHLGDWGTQFGMLIAHLKDEFPQYASAPPPISDLQAFYKASKLRFDEDAEFKKRAYESVVKLQSGDSDHVKAWKEICNISLKEFQKVYERLNVKITPRGESFYQKRMETLVEELKEQKLILLEEGRWVMYAEGARIPLTVVKSDGGFTYDTSDLACIRNRIEEEKGEWLIYVTDAGQSQHFVSFTQCAKKWGVYDPSAVRLDHVTFGVVLGEDRKKFKTRSGDTVRLVDLLNEGLERSDAKLREKSREDVLTPEEFNKAKEAVAYGCIKYADLCHDRTRDYVFSFERMLDFRGNTAAYLLYALTRIRSIARLGGVKREDVLKEASSGKMHFDHEKELKLAKILLKMPDVLVKITQDLYLHPLCEYLYEVSSVFTEFYDNCYCIEKDAEGKIVKRNMNRLVLCEATATVMEMCFFILGIETLGKM